MLPYCGDLKPHFGGSLLSVDDPLLGGGAGELHRSQAGFGRGDPRIDLLEMQVHLFDLGVGYIELFDGKQCGALKCELLSATLFDLSLLFFNLLLPLFHEGVLGGAGCAESQQRYDC